MPILTKNWETLTEMQERTGIAAEIVVETVKSMFKKRNSIVLFSKHGVKFKLRDWKAWGLKSIC